jgi:UDP-2-acetamido-2-deoxy-ribo-hexuluronate aminotransferase
MIPSVPFIDLTRHEPEFNEAVDKTFRDMIVGAQFIGGPQVKRIEERLTTYVSLDHAVSCANGTDAIQLALRAIGVGPGDKVLVPNVTFWATFEAVVNVGATPVTIDCDISDGGVNFHDFERAITEVAPKAALVAHLYGWGSARLTDLRELCKRYDVPLVEDGAQCFGTRFEGASIYAGALIATTSFYPAKVLGAAGDGGAVFTSDLALAETMRQLCNHGRTAHYGHGYVGWNSRLDALQAAYLNHALDVVEARIASRREAVTFYYEHLLPLVEKVGLEVMKAPQGYEENGYCNVCLVRDPQTKERIQKSLKAAGIGYGNIYPSPMSEQPGALPYLGGHVGGQMGHLLCASVLNLPLFPYMRRDELEYIVSILAQTGVAVNACQ